MLLDHLARFVAALGSASLLAACTTPFKTPAFDSRPPGSTEFSGIAQLVAVTPKRTLDVMMVHGMCTHDQVWAEETIKRLASMLNGVGELKIELVRVEGTKTILFRSTLSLPVGTVRVSALL